MKGVFIILCMLLATYTIAQDHLNQQRDLTKDEFNELRKQRDRFIPNDLTADTIVIVKYHPETLEALRANTIVKALAQNGEDATKTVNLSPSKRSLKSTQKYIDEYVNKYPPFLQKKGIKAVVIDEAELQGKRYANKYWLTKAYVCTQKFYGGQFIVTVADVIFDPKTQHQYEVLRAMNYDIFNLLD